MALGKTVFFKKLVDGALHLYLQDVDGVMAPRWFMMDHNVPRIGVPLNYALSLFIDANVEYTFKKNAFEVEGIADLVKIAEERGYIAVSEEEVKEIVAPKRNNAMLLSILKGGDTTKIKALFASADKERALDVAMSNAKVLSRDTVALIESIVGMAITEEE